MFCFRFQWNRATRTPTSCVVAGLGVESSVIESCDTNVEDVLADELGGPFDNPGTTMGT